MLLNSTKAIVIAILWATVLTTTCSCWHERAVAQDLFSQYIFLTNVLLMCSESVWRVSIDHKPCPHTVLYAMFYRSGNMWHSSAIESRIDNKRLKSSTGAIYRLKGCMDKLLALDSGMLCCLTKWTKKKQNNVISHN